MGGFRAVDKKKARLELHCPPAVAVRLFRDRSPEVVLPAAATRTIPPSGASRDAVLLRAQGRTKSGISKRDQGTTAPEASDRSKTPALAHPEDAGDIDTSACPDRVCSASTRLPVDRSRRHRLCGQGVATRITARATASQGPSTTCSVARTQPSRSRRLNHQTPLLSHGPGLVSPGQKACCTAPSVGWCQPPAPARRRTASVAASSRSSTDRPGPIGHGLGPVECLRPFPCTQWADEDASRVREALIGAIWPCVARDARPLA